MARKAKAAAPKPAPPVPAEPQISADNQAALTNVIKSKYESIAETNASKAGFRGFSSSGEAMYGNPLDGFTPEAIAQLKDMVEHPLGSPRVAEILPANAPQPGNVNNMLPNVNKSATQPAPAVRPALDVDDIFGLK